MVLIEKGIICGGDKYSPKIDTFSNSKRLTFKVLFTRGGNKVQNYDVFEIKVLGRLAEDYYDKMSNDKLQGETIRLQLSLENNSKTGNMEFICSYIQFNLGEDIVLANCPNFALKKSTKLTKETSVSDETEVLNEENIEESVVNDETIPSNVVSVTVETPVFDETSDDVNDNDVDDVEEDEEVSEDSFVIDETLLHQAPIGLVNGARELIQAEKILKVKRHTKGDLANDAGYAVFRSMFEV